MVRHRSGGRGSHSSGAGFAPGLKRPTRMTSPETGRGLRPMSSLFGLAPGGVYPAIAVASNAVGSYPTLSPLPRRHRSRRAGTDDGRGGLLSVALSLGLPPPEVIRHRVSVEPGLSSPRCLSTLRGAAARPTGNGLITEPGGNCQKIRDCPKGFGKGRSARRQVGPEKIDLVLAHDLADG